MQHVVAMFGATFLVPTLTDFPPSTTLLFSGVGTILFLLITGIIYTFKSFDLIAVLTKGGPAGSTSLMVWYMYETAFLNLKIGYASAIGTVLFISVLIITLVQWAGQKKWVNY